MVYEETDLTTRVRRSDSTPDKPLLSIVVPLFNEHEVFGALQTRLLELQTRIGAEYAIQIVLVDEIGHLESIQIEWNRGPAFD